MSAAREVDNTETCNGTCPARWSARLKTEESEQQTNQITGMAFKISCDIYWICEEGDERKNKVHDQINKEESGEEMGKPSKTKTSGENGVISLVNNNEREP